MATAIGHVRPPPKLLKEMAALAQIGNTFLNAAQSPLFNAKEQEQYKLLARAYLGFLRDEAPARLAQSS